MRNMEEFDQLISKVRKKKRLLIISVWLGILIVVYLIGLLNFIITNIFAVIILLSSLKISFSIAEGYGKSKYLEWFETSFKLNDSDSNEILDKVIRLKLFTSTDIKDLNISDIDKNYIHNYLFNSNHRFENINENYNNYIEDNDVVILPRILHNLIMVLTILISLFIPILLMYGSGSQNGTAIIILFIVSFLIILGLLLKYQYLIKRRLINYAKLTMNKNGLIYDKQYYNWNYIELNEDKLLTEFDNMNLRSEDISIEFTYLITNEAVHINFKSDEAYNVYISIIYFCKNHINE